MGGATTPGIEVMLEFDYGSFPYVKDFCFEYLMMWSFVLIYELDKKGQIVPSHSFIIHELCNCALIDSLIWTAECTMRLSHNQ